MEMSLALWQAGGGGNLPTFLPAGKIFLVKKFSLKKIQNLGLKIPHFLGA